MAKNSTRQNWTAAHPRTVVNLGDSTGAAIVGFGADGVWVAKPYGRLTPFPEPGPLGSVFDPGLGGEVTADLGLTPPSEASTFQDAAMPTVGFEANAGWRTGDHPRHVVDLTGDGRVDLLGFGDAGVWTSLGDGRGGFGEVRSVLNELSFSRGWSAQFPRFVEDLTGDGRPDIVGFGEDGMWVALNRGDGGFDPAKFVNQEFSSSSGWQADRHPRFIRDITGDGRADAIGFGDAGVWTTVGDGAGGFQPAKFVLAEMGFDNGWRVENHLRLVERLGGNAGADLIGFGDAGVWTAMSLGDGGFAAAQFVLSELAFQQGWRVDKHPRLVADLTGDGNGDLIGFGDAGVWTALGNGDGTFQPARFVLANFGYNQGWRVDDHPRMLVDTTGDGKLDIIGFGDAGVWIAHGTGDGGFAAAEFVHPDFGRASNVDTIIRREIVHDHRFPGRIKHLFVLMLENRSYDHMLGFAHLSGPDAATGEPTVADGLTGAEFNTYQGAKFPVIRGAPDVTVGPGHNFTAALEQLCGSVARYPSGGPYPEVNTTGYVSSLARSSPDAAPGDVMRCFTPEQLPILTTLAREFAVCDRWFSSMPGPTEPNRYFSHAGTSANLDESPTTRELIEWSTTPGGGIEFDGGNIFGKFADADVEIRIYRGDRFPVAGEMDGVSNTFDTTSFDDFAEDVNDPDFDASFIHIEPKYFDGFDTISGDFGGGNSQHPDGGVAAGERLIKKVYETIRNSPHWESSMLVITYDEHGGFYDHVAPGAAEPSGSKGRSHGFMFDQLGARVPAVIVSPFIARGTIEHRLLEHCSIITTACELFGVPLLSHCRDLHTICGFAHLAGLSEARSDTPATLPAVVVSAHHSLGSAAVPPAARAWGREGAPATAVMVDDANALTSAGDMKEDLLAMTTRNAALQDLRLDPARKPEVLARLEAIHTQSEAAAYIKEVEARLKELEPA